LQLFCIIYLNKKEKGGEKKAKDTWERWPVLTEE